ncbi:MAG: AAA family ATPase [Chloroflexota bacterium]
MAHLHNPYRYEGPVSGEDFFGREADLDACQEAIEDRACLSVVGGPCAGLTSLAYRLVTPAFRERCQAVCGPLMFALVECTQFEEPPQLLRHLIAHLAPESEFTALAEEDLSLAHLVAALDEAQPRHGVVVLDDFEYLGRQDDFSPVLSFLRALVPHASLSVITTGHIELKNCCSASLIESPFTNIFAVRYLGALSQAETEALVADRSRRAGLDLALHLPAIVSLSGTQPCFLQLACALYHDAVARDGQPDHDALADAFLERARPALNRIWHSLSVEERDALHALANLAPNDRIEDSLRERNRGMAGLWSSSAFWRYLQGLA